MSSPIIPILLAGGAGTRLWPVSRDALPKQYSVYAVGFCLTLVLVAVAVIFWFRPAEVRQLAWRVFVVRFFVPYRRRLSL